MDRVYRSRLVIAPLLAIQMALGTASLSMADSPSNGDSNVDQAIAYDSADGQNTVQQVAGKQTTLRKTKPGLLQALAGNRSDSGEPNEAKPSTTQGKGLLNTILQGRTNGSRSQAQSSRNPHNGQTQRGPSQNRQSQNGQSRNGQTQRAGSPSTANRPSGNARSNEWDGVPYHRVSQSQPNMGSQPLRNPDAMNAPSGTAATGTRIIRGGSSNRINAQPVSTRRSNGPTPARAPAPALAIPTPPADLEPLPAPQDSLSRDASSLSRESSSRRSNRRELRPLDPAEIAAASKLTPKKSESETSELVPRVRRKQVAARDVSSSAASKPVSEPTPTSEPAPTPEPATASTPEMDTAVAEVSKPPTPAIPSPKAPAQPTGTPSRAIPTTNVARTNPTPAPQAQVAPAPTPTPQAQLPAAQTTARAPLPAAQIPTAQIPTAQIPTSQIPTAQAQLPTTQVPAAGVPQAERPVAQLPPSSPTQASPTQVPAAPLSVPAPATTVAGNPPSAIPVTGIPTQPYAAPSPSVPSMSASHRSGPPTSAFQPTTPEFKATASPIGSGIANGEVASFRSNTVPSGQPSIGGYAVPSADRTVDTQRRMTTFGQPVAPGASGVPGTTSTNATNPNLPNRSVTESNVAGNANATGPTNVAGNAPSMGTPTTDNFARTDYDGRNQMRENAGNPGVQSAASTSELPGVRVQTFGPATMMLRETRQYEIRVENRGAIDATGVMVRATVPKWAELRSRNATRGSIENEASDAIEHLVWQIDHLPAGSSEQMFVRLTAAKSGTFDLDVDWTLIPQRSITKIQVHEPKLDLTIEGPDEVVFGKSQTYKVRVLNPGDGTAPNVVFTLSPNSATPQTQRIGDIPPGKEAQFDVELTAQDLGDLQIHGLASGDLDLRTEAMKTIKVAAAQLEAILSGPELKYRNTDAVYNLQIQNTGAAASEKIIAKLRIPNGVKYLGGMDNATLQGDQLKWEITSLPAGATRDYQFKCTMTSTGEHLFAFDCSGTAAGNASVSLATRVESIADLVLTVSDPPAPAPIGSDVTYEIVIRNRGSKEATDVKAIAQFSHGIEPQRIEGVKGEVVTGQVLFDSIPRIDAGQEIRMRVIAKADRGGHHRFRTEVRSGDTVLVAEEATHYMSPQSDRVSRRSSDDGNR